MNSAQSDTGCLGYFTASAPQRRPLSRRRGCSRSGDRCSRGTAGPALCGRLSIPAIAAASAPCCLAESAALAHPYGSRSDWRPRSWSDQRPCGQQQAHNYDRDRVGEADLASPIAEIRRPLPHPLPGSFVPSLRHCHVMALPSRLAIRTSLCRIVHPCALRGSRGGTRARGVPHFLCFMFAKSALHPRGSRLCSVDPRFGSQIALASYASAASRSLSGRRCRSEMM